MPLLKWIKENVFDWSAEPPSRRSRPPETPPGYENRQRSKRANKARTRRGGRGAGVGKNRTGKAAPRG